MKPIISLFFIVFFSVTCQPISESNSINQPNSLPQNNMENSITYLALGDSYTIGESVAENERWPVVLANELNTKGMEVAKPKIIARTGWTTNELQEAIEKEEMNDTFGLVSLLIGVNNQYRGYPFEQYENEFVALLNTAIDFANGDSSKIFVVSIPDYGVTAFAANSDTAKIARELDQYNLYAKTVCEEKNIPFFDITPISRKAKEDLELVASDELHPSGKMYAQWVEFFVDEVVKMVE